MNDVKTILAWVDEYPLDLKLFAAENQTPDRDRYFKVIYDEEYTI